MASVVLEVGRELLGVEFLSADMPSRRALGLSNSLVFGWALTIGSGAFGIFGARMAFCLRFLMVYVLLYPFAAYFCASAVPFTVAKIFMVIRN